MNELQSVLNLISSALLGDLASFLSPRLVIAKDDTASTDGRTWIRLPEEFLGIRLGEQMNVFIGLLAHEVGHWLQPLKAVTEVEKKTGLHHDIVNIVLDVHLEHLVPVIFPLFAVPLEAVRAVVRDAHRLRRRAELVRGVTGWRIGLPAQKSGCDGVDRPAG